MKLELKHVAPYLPYKLIVKYKEGFHYNIPPYEEYIVALDYEGVKIGGIELWVLYRNIKPILRPLSDLKTFDTSLFTPYFKHRMESDECFNYISDVPYSDMEKLFNLHFDVFGLIQNNLAIDINTLNK